MAWLPTGPLSLPTPMSLIAASRRTLLAAHLVQPVQQLEAERDRLGVHAVGAAHADRVFVLDGALGDSCLELSQVFGRISPASTMRIAVAGSSVS